MTVPTEPEPEFHTEVVQIIRGGEPEDDGTPLAGRRSPLLPTFNPRSCACTCIPMPYDLWERVDRLSPYGPNSDIWLRTCMEGQEDRPLPEGSVLIDTHRVSILVR